MFAKMWSKNLNTDTLAESGELMFARPFMGPLRCFLLPIKMKEDDCYHSPSATPGIRTKSKNVRKIFVNERDPQACQMFVELYNEPAYSSAEPPLHMLSGVLGNLTLKENLNGNLFYFIFLSWAGLLKRNCKKGRTCSTVQFPPIRSLKGCRGSVGSPSQNWYLEVVQGQQDSSEQMARGNGGLDHGWHWWTGSTDDIGTRGEVLFRKRSHSQCFKDSLRGSWQREVVIYAPDLNHLFTFSLNISSSAFFCGGAEVGGIYWAAYS